MIDDTLISPHLPFYLSVLLPMYTVTLEVCLTARSALIASLDVNCAIDLLGPSGTSGLCDCFSIDLGIPISSEAPSSSPSVADSATPSRHPSSAPSHDPSVKPSAGPSNKSSIQPSTVPSVTPSVNPSVVLSNKPSSLPSVVPYSDPSREPSHTPSAIPSESVSPTKIPYFQGLCLNGVLSNILSPTLSITACASAAVSVEGLQVLGPAHCDFGSRIEVGVNASLLFNSGEPLYDVGLYTYTGNNPDGDALDGEGCVSQYFTTQYTGFDNLDGDSCADIGSGAVVADVQFFLGSTAEILCQSSEAGGTNGKHCIYLFPSYFYVPKVTHIAH